VDVFATFLSLFVIVLCHLSLPVAMMYCLVGPSLHCFNDGTIDSQFIRLW